eukprot:TRINITY_DN2733_c1_g1_i3.p1 TRINITY_DN2733_c1_g1~~TRINITY_DN2733_c1_g1_i3.p1  ORF type:complete len:690 (+),score=260.28 TRINITY_DN2733_c1_g1_i3:59-2071(+)
MGKKVRKSTIPKAKVIDMSGEEKKVKAKAAVSEKGKGKGTYLAMKADSDSEDSDLGAALAFDKEPEMGEMDSEENSELEEMMELDSDMEEGAEEIEDDDDSFGLGDDDEFDEDEGPDSDESVDFEQKVNRAKAQLEAQQAEAAKETMLTRKAKVFSRSTGENDGLSDDGEEEEPEEEDEEEDAPAEQIPLEQRKERVEEVLKVLDNIEAQREGDHSRQEYLGILKDDLKEVYDYSEWLMGKLMELFPPRELFEFLETNEKQRPLTIRVNTIKQSRRDLAQALTRKGMSVEPTGPWCKVGLQIFESDVAVGSTAEYLAGHYLVQSASSFLPVLAMEVTEGMRVLDMAAAPGGKTTHIAQLMKNTGTLMANDVSAERLIALRGNMLRMGNTNTVITNYNGVGYDRVMKNFDRVLLDAPCTGLGVISRDPRIKASKTERDVTLCAMLQKKLILSAIDCCKVGGTVVYSTCSILVEENEATVDYALKHRNIRIVETGLPFGRPGMTKFRKSRFHHSVGLSRRYYPHAFNMDGFYVCKIEKLAHGENTSSLWHKEKKEDTKKGKKRGQPEGMPEPPLKVQKRKADAIAGAELTEKPKEVSKMMTIKKVPVVKGVKKERRSRWKRKNQKDKEKQLNGKKSKKDKVPAEKPVKKDAEKKPSVKKAAPKKKSIQKTKK